MARRNFARPHRLHALNELNVTPLLDLCFCLLIIFMIATPVMEASKRVDLPETSGPSSGSGKTKSVSVSFDAVSYQYDGRNVSLAELREKFHELAGLDKDMQPVVKVRGDRNAPYDRVAQLISAFQSEGLTKLSIDYKQH